VKRIFGLLLIISLISGCRTGGSTLSSGNLVKGSDGIWRLKKPIRETPQKPPIIKNEPKIIDIKSPEVKVTKGPVITKPTAPVLPEVKPEELPPADIKAAGSLKPLTPTVSSNLIPVLPTREKELPKKESKVNVITKVEGVTNVPAKEKSSLKIHWLVLLGAIIMAIWMLYDLYKEFKNKTITPTKKTKPRKKRGRPRKNVEKN
jgi:hypothetical protein